MTTNGIAMQANEENSTSATNCPKNDKKRKQPEPTDLSENTQPIFAPEIPVKVSILKGLFWVQYEKSKWTDPSICVITYQFFAGSELKNLITLTLKNLSSPSIIITVRSKSQDHKISHPLENHKWITHMKRLDRATGRDNNIFDIIMEVLSKEFYIHCWARIIQDYFDGAKPIQNDKPLTCCNPECTERNSFNLGKKILTLQPSLVMLKCGHYFHRSHDFYRGCSPVDFCETAGACSVCGTLIEDKTDFFVCTKKLPQITVND
jgi:hypothetical protein